MIPKLKPVIYVRGQYPFNNIQNTTQQIMLLKALRITQDPKKLRELIGVKTVADVYRTLDKIAMRKEYHAALAESGITFDYVVKNVKGIIDGAEKDSDRLAGLNMILKSIGLDKYEESANVSGGWEDALLALKDGQEDKEAPLKITEYAVTAPEMPEDVRIKKEKANAETRTLYE
jgi:hypothetical protein